MNNLFHSFLEFFNAIQKFDFSSSNLNLKPLIFDIEVIYFSLHLLLPMPNIFPLNSVKFVHKRSIALILTVSGPTVVMENAEEDETEQVKAP